MVRGIHGGSSPGHTNMPYPQNAVNRMPMALYCLPTAVYCHAQRIAENAIKRMDGAGNVRGLEGLTPEDRCVEQRLGLVGG